MIIISTNKKEKVATRKLVASNHNFYGNKIDIYEEIDGTLTIDHRKSNKLAMVRFGKYSGIKKGSKIDMSITFSSYQRSYKDYHQGLTSMRDELENRRMNIANLVGSMIRVLNVNVIVNVVG